MKKFDVIIVGNGISAHSTAWHLAQHGIGNVAIVSPAKIFSGNANQWNFGSATFVDNISRISHQHGNEKAKRLLQLNLYGFKNLQTFLSRNQMNYTLGKTIRISESSHETKEMNLATSWLRDVGYPSSLHEHTTCAVQQDGAASIIVDYSALLTRLNESSKITTIFDYVTGIESYDGAETIRLKSGQSLRSEMIVLACHTSIKKLLPQMEDALISYADQKTEFEVASKSSPLNTGDVVFSNHSQFWAVDIGGKKIICGGARFMRKWAGVEATHAETSSQITDCVQAKIEKILDIKLKPKSKPVGFLDIRPCDELPVIGPMYGHSNILIASGYMGSGLTLGFAAGKGLADFIYTGQSNLIPEFLHPKRFRSLSENYETSEIKD